MLGSVEVAFCSLCEFTRTQARFLQSLMQGMMQAVAVATTVPCPYVVGQDVVCTFYYTLHLGMHV